MSGSEQQSKTLPVVENQLPLKGFNGTFKDAKSKRVYRIEGMGDGRFRLHSVKRQPKQE